MSNEDPETQPLFKQGDLVFPVGMKPTSNCAYMKILSRPMLPMRGYALRGESKYNYMVQCFGYANMYNENELKYVDPMEERQDPRDPDRYYGGRSRGATKKARRRHSRRK